MHHAPSVHRYKLWKLKPHIDLLVPPLPDPSSLLTGNGLSYTSLFINVCVYLKRIPRSIPSPTRRLYKPMLCNVSIDKPKGAREPSYIITIILSRRISGHRSLWFFPSLRR